MQSLLMNPNITVIQVFTQQSWNLSSVMSKNGGFNNEIIEPAVVYHKEFIQTEIIPSLGD